MLHPCNPPRHSFGPTRSPRGAGGLHIIPSHSTHHSFGDIALLFGSLVQPLMNKVHMGGGGDWGESRREGGEERGEDRGESRGEGRGEGVSHRPGNSMERHKGRGM